MSHRLALLSFAAALFIAIPARAQLTPGAVSVAVTMKNSLPRLDANGNLVTKRIDPASSEGVNLSDCHADQSIQIPLVVTGFLPGDLAEIWASNGAVDCTDPQFRPGTQSVHCVKIGSFPLVNTPLTTIKVKALLAATGITTLDSFGCPSVDISSVTLYFMVFRGGAATAPAGSDTVPIKVDTQGPLPLSGVKALPGNHAITVSWDAAGEAGAQDIIGAQALCDPAPAPSTATDSGTSMTCIESGAAAADADASETPEPTCTSAASEAGAAGGPIPAAAGIPSNGLACTTAAFTNSTAVACGTPVTGTTGNTIRIDNINGMPLQNGVVYAVAVGGTDSFQNVGSVSTAICQFPEATSDFWSDYRSAGGQSGGCSVEGPAVPLGSLSLMMIGIVVALSTLRRARRSTRKAAAPRAPRRIDR